MHIIQIQGTVVDLIISLPPETPCHLVCVLSQPHIYLYLWAFALAVPSIWNAVPSPWLPQFYLSRSSSSPWVCSKLSLPTLAHVNLFLLEFSIVWNSVMIFLFLQSQVARLLSERWGKDAGKQKQQPSQLSTLLGTCHTKHMSPLPRTCHMQPSDPHLHSAGPSSGKRMPWRHTQISANCISQMTPYYEAGILEHASFCWFGAQFPQHPIIPDTVTCYHLKGALTHKNLFYPHNNSINPIL